jgi:hypothetical protein
MKPLRSIPLDLATAAAVSGIPPEQIVKLMNIGVGPTNLSLAAIAKWVTSGKAAKWKSAA